MHENIERLVGHLGRSTVDGRRRQEQVDEIRSMAVSYGR